MNFSKCPATQTVLSEEHTKSHPFEINSFDALVGVLPLLLRMM